jgi:CBS domain-containing protein
MAETTAEPRRFPPLAELPDDEYARVLAESTTQTFGEGETILHEDGAPADHLYVICSGSIELVHDGELIDVLEPGEAFGHPSLLSGLAPAFDVRARMPSSCLLIPGDAARRVLAGAAGVSFVATSLRERMIKTGYVAHARGDVRTASLGSLVHRPLPVVRPTDSVREAARVMASADVSCALVELGAGGYGVITDSDLRRNLVAAGLSYDTPVEQLMTAPALTFPAERMAVDAMIDMLDAGIHHVPVVDEGGTPVGLVTATDLMYLESRTPFALRRSIAHAKSVEEVVAAASHLPQTVVALIRAGVPATDVGRVLASSGDAATIRLIDLAFERHGPAPAAWAWMALGSTARRESSLASDQDNAIAYADDAEDGFFERVAIDVNAGLAECGFGADNAEVLARNRIWRMSRADWERVFSACLEQPDRSHLVRAAVAFDFRHVWGGLEIVPPLVEIERQAPNYPDFLRRMARTATDIELPLGFRKRLQVDDDGTIDVKHGAIVPICNLARFHALSRGITISSTLGRLQAAEAEGALDVDTADALRESFELVTRLRLQHQTSLSAAGEPADNLVRVSDLPPLTRAQLTAAIKAIEAAQRQLSRFVPYGV